MTGVHNVVKNYHKVHTVWKVWYQSENPLAQITCLGLKSEDAMLFGILRGRFEISEREKIILGYIYVPGTPSISHLVSSLPYYPCTRTMVFCHRQAVWLALLSHATFILCVMLLSSLNNQQWYPIFSHLRSQLFLFQFSTLINFIAYYSVKTSKPDLSGLIAHEPHVHSPFYHSQCSPLHIPAIGQDAGL